MLRRSHLNQLKARFSWADQDSRQSVGQSPSRRWPLGQRQVGDDRQLQLSPRRDLRLVPAAVAVWAGMWLIITVSWGGQVAALAALVAAVLAWRFRSAPVALLTVALTVTVTVGVLRVAWLTSGPISDLADERAVGQATLMVTSVRLASQGETVVVRAQLAQANARGQTYRTQVPVLLFASGDDRDAWSRWTPGSRISATVRWETPERTDAVAAVLDPLSEPLLVAEASGWRAAVESVRRSFRQAVSQARPEQAALLPALVIGDTSTMPAGLTDDFKTCGLTHLTAVSGANLTILLAFLLGIARWFGLRGRALNGLALVGVVAFVALCQAEPSVLRAAAMGLVGLAALSHSAQPGTGLRHLTVAIIGLCWVDPWLSHSFGFALSVVACGGILWWARPWTEALAQWLPRWVAEAVAVPLSAQLATQPIVAGLAGTVSVSGLAANVLAGPWVGPATVAGLVTALVAVVSATVGGWVGSVTPWLVEPILRIAHGAAALPGSAQAWPAEPFSLVALGLVCLVVAGLMPSVLSRWSVTLALAVVLVVAVLRPPPSPGWPPDSWALVACDVGQGDAVAVRVSQEQVLLIDIGPPAAGLPACLRSLGVEQVPLVILSHLHADHAGGLAELVAAWPVGSIAVSAADADDPALDVARQRGIEITAVQPGSTITLGEAVVEVVAGTATPGAAASDGEESSAENDASLVTRVTSGGVSVLATGDLEVAGQIAAQSSQADLTADVLKVPHHGSARQDPEFLAATGAQIALISVGLDNSYGHPAESALRRLTSLGMTIARTDEHGAIAIRRANGVLTITSQR